ncbi:hypothetical protein ACVWVY_004041 [Bradyrhizobium sp. URHC0002]
MSLISLASRKSESVSKEGVDESAQHYGDTIVDASGAEFDAQNALASPSRAMISSSEHRDRHQ